MNITLTTEQKIRLSLAPVTESGKPANVDGAPKWTVTEGNATLNVDEDGMSAEIISSDEPGPSTVLVTADADLDEGEEREISETIAVNVTAAEAAGLGLTIGTPEPK